MTGKTFLGRSLAVSSLLSTAIAAAPAWAQNTVPSDPPASATSGTVGAASDIIVTARGRGETLQAAPVSVTAFSSQAIDDARIKDVASFIGITPNISIVKSQSVGNSFVTIRGISQVRNGESPIAVVTDGVQQVTSRQFTADLFDVQQIEVLRGPQGALYGRNAIGGAILITTKQPTNEFVFNGQASAGNGDDYRAEASISGPLAKDVLLFRLAGSVRNFGGLLNNVFLGVTNDKIRDRNVRGQLNATLGGGFSADLRASYRNTAGVGGQFQYQGANFLPNSCFVNPANPFGGPAPDADRVNRNFCANNRGDNKRTIFDASLKLRYEGQWGTVTNVLSYLHIKENLKADQFPYSASRNVFGVTDGTQTQFEDLEAWQNDFRIASSSRDHFRWMVGAYYLGTERFISTTTGFDNGLGILDVFQTPNGPTSINPTLSFLADNNKNRAYAFYGNVAYDVTDKLEASFAYRYDHDRRRQMISPLSTAGVPAGCTAAAISACTRTASFSKGQPKFTLTYRPSADLTLFANYGVGFRSGQYNQSGAAAAANLPGVFDLVRQESASTAELGVKFRSANGIFRVNATAFHTQDKNPFYFVFVGSIGAQILVNIDEVKLYGGEIEAIVSPVRGLDLFVNYGYTHSRISKFDFNPATIGNKAPYIPQDGGALGAQYRVPVTTALNLFARGEVEHHGKQFWDPENSTSRSSFQLVNLRGGIESEDGRWAVTGYVRNLTDKKYNAEFVSGGFVAPGEPRTYGIELRGRF